MREYKVGDEVWFEGRLDEIVWTHLNGSFDLRSGKRFVRNYELEAGRYSTVSRAIIEEILDNLRKRKEKVMSEAKFGFGERVEVRFIGIIEGVERDPWNKQIVYRVRAQGDSLKCVIESASVSELVLRSAEDLEVDDHSEPENSDVLHDWNERNPRHAD